MQRNGRTRWWTLGVVICLFGCLAAFMIVRTYQAKALRSLAEARKLLRRGQYDQAEVAAIQASERLGGERLSEAHWIAAQSAYGMNLFESTLQHLSLLETSQGDLNVKQLSMRAACQFRLGDALRAEEDLRAALRLAPDDFAACNQLTALLRIQGRSYEALPYLARLLRQGMPDQNQLLAALSTESLYLANSDAANAKTFIDTNPSNRVPLLAIARLELGSQEYPIARSRLESIVASQPELMEAQAALGHLYLTTGDNEALQSWLTQPELQDAQHPGVWVVRGVWAQGLNQPKQAARCFWEALRLEPNLLAGNYLLGAQLAALGRAEEAQPFVDRAATLTQVMELTRRELDEASIDRLISLLFELGRSVEAEGWRRFAEKQEVVLPTTRDPIAMFEGEGLTDPKFNPALQLNLEDYPLPDNAKLAGDARPSATTSAVSFVDIAEEAGVAFQHYNGADPSGQRKYMFELSGGAAIVLDYDLDGWADLYLTQGAAWPVNIESEQRADRLFRNQRDGTFVDVTESAGLGDTGLTQSAAAGDMDNDGYPDLWIANLGANALYRNNGDGTFEKVALPQAIAGDAWSSSVAWADLDGDGLDDVYVANYLGGPDVFTRQCEHNGKPVQCHPRLFPGVRDQLLINRGDGTFHDRSDLLPPAGKGLGLMVADLDGDARLDVFVANDAVANFALMNRGEGKDWRFEDQSLLMGLAFDERGYEQSCMGVALSDVEGDGRLDLFVTNFYREPNTLYRQNEAGTFSDQTRAANLRDSSFLTMGWGAQFIDFELDGDPDLAIANGHLNDYRDRGEAFEMPTDLVSNNGGRFERIAADSLGEYFQRSHLGRAVARLDLNQDGLEDLCVTHIDQPTAMLLNRTQPVGRGLSILLTGTTCPRDAVGAKVTVNTSDGSSQRQLTAGDGFAAGNERCLVFAVDPEAQIESIDVVWPDGQNQSYLHPGAPDRIRLIQGRPDPVAAP